MDKRIERYIICHYYELLAIAKKITKEEELYKDLLQEVMLQLLEKDKIELKEYDESNIKYYIVAVMRINWYSSTSPFYYKMRKPVMNFVEFDGSIEMEDEQHHFEREQLIKLTEQQFTEMGWFKKSLFEMYMVLGSLKNVSHHTNIPLASVTKYVKDTRTEIKANVNKLRNL